MAGEEWKPKRLLTGPWPQVSSLHSEGPTTEKGGKISILNHMQSFDSYMELDIFITHLRTFITCEWPESLEACAIFL